MGLPNYRVSAPVRPFNRSWELPHLDTAGELHHVAKRLGRWMDSAFEVPLVGWRFGLDALVGLLPGVGDMATTLVSLYIVALAHQAGVPRITIARMGLNVAIDMLVGAVPVVGDLFDVWWKANLRNVALLEQRLAENPHSARRDAAGDWLFVGAVMMGLVVLLAATLTLAALALGALWRAAFGA